MLLGVVRRVQADLLYLKIRRGTQVAQGRGLQNLHSWVRIPPAPPTHSFQINGLQDLHRRQGQQDLEGQKPGGFNRDRGASRKSRGARWTVPKANFKSCRFTRSLRNKLE